MMESKIKGQKINLRRLRKSDAKSLYQNAKDKDICKAVPLPYPYTLKHAQDYIRLTHQYLRKKSEYQFGIEDKETGQVIGMIGLMDLDFKDKKAEVGYWLGKKYWGQGMTKEALLLILNFAFKRLKFQRVYAKVNHTNINSCKLLEKCCFKLEGRLRKHGRLDRKWVDLLIYGILGEEYRK